MGEVREFQDGEVIGGTRYRVLRLIGKGGMGSVYEVEHRELGKRFVLKALLRELARREDLVQRLRNEWRALGRLEHPNIVTVTDAGTSSNGVPFYVMERLQGETLSERMRRVGRLGIAEATAITASILDGLSAAHAIGIVHRDIKPSNVILMAGDHPKILDFGVAKIAGESGVVTARGAAIGTPRYMSPEQARGERVDGRTDLYASGLLLFEMVTGAGPFDDAKDSNELFLAQIARRAPSLASRAVGVSRELDRAVEALLEKNHEQRPSTARAAAQRLRAAVSPGSDFEAIDSGGSALRPQTPGPRAFSGTTDPGGFVTFSTPASFLTVSDPMDRETTPSNASTPRLLVDAAKTEVLTAVPTPEASATRTQLPALPVTPAPVTPPPSSIPARESSTSERGRRSAKLALGVGGVLLATGALALMALELRRGVSDLPLASPRETPFKQGPPAQALEPGRGLVPPARLSGSTAERESSVSPPASSTAAAPRAKALKRKVSRSRERVMPVSSGTPAAESSVQSVPAPPSLPAPAAAPAAKIISEPVSPPAPATGTPIRRAPERALPGSGL